MEDHQATINPADSIRLLTEEIQVETIGVQKIKEEIARVIVGQKQMIDRLLIALLADGHVLLEGVPGLAKTLAVKTLSDTLDLSFNRIQFTPDLLPADVTGTMIFNQKKEEFKVLFLQILFLQMKLIGRRQKSKVHYLKPCRKNRLLWAMKLFTCRNLLSF